MKSARRYIRIRRSIKTCVFLFLSLYLPAAYCANESVDEKISEALTNETAVVEAGFTKGSNLDISFFIVEHVEAAGNSHRFSANKLEANDSSTLQGFSMFISTILPEREIGQVVGVFQIGDELWSFGIHSTPKYSATSSDGAKTGTRIVQVWSGRPNHISHARPPMPLPPTITTKSGSPLFAS
jgi:hypothetical protein